MFVTRFDAVLGVPLMVFRDSSGNITRLLNTCPASTVCSVFPSLSIHQNLPAKEEVILGGEKGFPRKDPANSRQFNFK